MVQSVTEQVLFDQLRMRLDTGQALRLVLPAESETLRPQEVPVGQGARWMRLDTKQALRPVLSLPNPSAMQGARWMSVDSSKQYLGSFY